MRKPRGHIRPHGAGHEVAVPLGRHPVTGRYRYAYQQARTREEAGQARARMLADLAAGQALRHRASFGQLLDEVITVAGLDPQAMCADGGYAERTIREALGTIRLRDLEESPGLIDRLYAELRRCERLCGGRRGLVDHWPDGGGAGTSTRWHLGQRLPRISRRASPAKKRLAASPA